ncbi:MAG: GspE/PulE family protein [Candidatus Pacebacteria bacterium]|nr:GspE/PulE family protein [Candidatus Paceibacterota bacterium]
MENSVFLGKLVEKGIINSAVYEKLFKELNFSNKPADEIIYERRLADSYKMAELKGELLGVPFRKVSAQEIGEDIMSFIPEETVSNYKVIPISKSGDMLTVGMVYPDDPRAQDALRFVAKKFSTSLGVYVISLKDFDEISKKYSPYKSEVEAAVKLVGQKYGTEARSSSQRVVRLDEGAAVSEEAPIIKIVSSTLQEAVDLKASDIHIEPQRTRLRIRFRIDGDLQEVASFPSTLQQPIVARVKVLSELKLDENRIPQDGRFRTVVSGRDIDFRVATFPTPAGEKVVLRILDPTIGLKGLEQLGLSEHNRKIINIGIEKPFGMVIVSGPTGSGKTTTLYSILQILNKDSANIVSLEDPVEYYIEGLNQSQVRPEIGYTFSAGLRQILRQDPDVIMVGEIRDSETAELAVHAALTGHVVLSTIHTNNAVSVIPRLLDMKVQKFLLPSAMNLMASQRLVGRLCPDCKKAVKVSAEIGKEIEKVIANLPKEEREKIKTPYQVYKAEGCSKCKNKGTVGRVALFEIFEMTKELAEILSLPNYSGTEILKEANRQGMLTLRQDGVLKALDGEVMIEEVLRETAE